MKKKHENGNYLNARELILYVKDTLDELSLKMEKLPGLMLESGTSSMPSQISELKEGYQGMIDQGYKLSHIQFDVEVSRLETNLKTFKEHLENAEVEIVEQGMNELRDSLNVLYDLLEKEVLSKQYVLKNNEKLKELIESAEDENNKLHSRNNHGPTNVSFNR